MRSVGCTKPKVLIADDEEALLVVLREYLGCCGFEVHTARQPEEARSLLASGPYAVVITDLRFSGPEGEEGLDIARAARQRWPDGRVVLMTGYPSPQVEEAARQIGVEALLPKPVPIWDLARIVLDGHSA